MPRKKSEFAPGKNPNSLANLKLSGTQLGGQNFYTRLAAMLNWEDRNLKAAISHFSQSAAASYASSYVTDWVTLSQDRRAALIDYEQELIRLQEHVVKVQRLLQAIRETPLRTPEAHQDRLKRRREARKKQKLSA